MRKLLATAASAALATALLGAATISPAAAQCPGNDGTLPGTPASREKVGPFWIDDRQFTDLDDDGDAGGLWVYYETAKMNGLQTGGDQVALATLAGYGVSEVPYIPGIPTPIPHPTEPRNIKLLGDGIGGGSISEEVGFHDDCKAKVDPKFWDQIVF